MQSELNENKGVDYSRVEAIREQIPPRKHTARYVMHRYFTRRPYNVIQEYIKNFSNKGDVGLDPFLGTGVTAIESLILRRKAIGIDIAPLSVFISENIAKSPTNLSLFQKEFQMIESECKDYIQGLYKKLDCEIEKLKIDYWYPKNYLLPSNSDVKTVDQLFTKRQLLALSKLLHHIKEIKNKDIKELMKFVFSSTLTFVNKMYDRGSSSPFAYYRYWVPKKFKKINAWDYFERRYRAVLHGKKETNALIGDFYNKENCKIFKESATNLSRFIEPNSVDYIFTDPPYGANIAYLDLSAMWNAWLDFKVEEQDYKNEVIEGGDLGKSQREYINLLSKSFQEMFKVLKDGRWMSVVFHHKELKLWYAVVNSCKDAGFDYINAVSQPIHPMPTMHKIQSPLRTLAGELIINFKKSKERIGQRCIIKTDVKNLILNTAERLIVKNHGATTDDIYHAIIPELLDANLIDLAVKEVNDITPLLKKEFFYKYDRWYVKNRPS